MRARSLAAHEAADREVVGSICAFEEIELLSVRPLFWREPKPRRARDSAHRDWVGFLAEHEVGDVKSYGDLTANAYGNVRVPRWVNDLCCALRTLRRTYENGSLSPFTGDHAEAVRLVSRAVRAAQRAPAFRIALAAKCAEVRKHIGGAREFPASIDYDQGLVGRSVLDWLRAHDWSDARPGAVFR